MNKASLRQELWEFFCCLGHYLRYRFFQLFIVFEKLKSWVASQLYRQRGRWVRPFIHAGMAFLIVGGITLGPVLIEENFTDPWKNTGLSTSVLTAVAFSAEETGTLISAKPRAEIIEYQVESGDTVSTIAEKFGISVDTIRWENNLQTVTKITPGQKLKILPATGVMYKVSHGDTVYTIAKKYQVDAQVIVNWPYNSFSNDETFALAVGQGLMIPEGIKPKEVPTAPRTYYAQVPAAGTAVGTGQFVWPVGGNISQSFAWYHPAIDIANHAGPAIVAADGGTVVLTGWPAPWAYGNRIIIDHGSGLTTLYAHLSQIYVSPGQQVAKGQTIGKMGSTGRSTGTHLHFEVRANGTAQNPLNYLR